MRISRPHPWIRETVALAQKIATIPDSELPTVMGEMMYKRELFRAVSALNDLAGYPEHRRTAVKALDKMQLWCAG